MKKVFLISNNYTVNDNNIKKVDIKDSDIVVLFNHAPLKYYKPIRQHKHKIIFLRENMRGFTGLQHTLNNHSIYEKIICVTHNDISKYNNITDNLKNISRYTLDECKADIEENPQLHILKQYHKYRHYTTGLYAIVYAIKYLSAYKLHLVDFTGYISKDKEIDLSKHYHDYLFERKFFDYLKENNMAEFVYFEKD